MPKDRLDNIPVDKVAEIAQAAATSILKERLGDWNGQEVEIGIFPDGGIVGGKIHCKTLRRVSAEELVTAAGEIHAKLADSIVGLDLEVRIVDRIITMGGKLGPDIVFDRFGA
ncbi:MAG: hypothetical protein AAFY39_05545 [Pseudomonadota bacterium]